MFLTPTIISKLHEQTFVQRLLRDKVMLVDSSEFSYWSGCPAKGLFYGGLRRSPATNQAALVFGGAIHEGLEVWILGGTIEAALAAVTTYCVANRLEDFVDSKRTTAKAREMLESYIHQATITNKRFVPLEVNGQKMVEQTFSFPLGIVKTEQAGDITIMWSGKMDVLAHFNNAIWVVDHKTTSMMGDKFVDDKVRSNQVNGYVWAARQLLAPIARDVEGCIINALCHRLKDYEFKQFEIPVAEWKIAEWRHETLSACAKIIDDVLSLITANTVLTPNREACVTKYGKCPYFDLCDSHENLRERMLYDNSFFQDNTWNPTGAE